MKFIIYVVLFTMLMSACTPGSDNGENHSDSKTFYIDKNALSTGVLKIHLPEDKPNNLSIRDPAGEWFVVQNADDSIEALPQHKFESSDVIEFKLDQLKGVIWRDSIKTTELVFKTSGLYLIYFADNLETEPENTYSFQETINYKPR